MNQRHPQQSRHTPHGGSEKTDTEKGTRYFKDTSRPKTNTTRGGHGGGVLAKVSLFVREMNARNE